MMRSRLLLVLFAASLASASAQTAADQPITTIRTTSRIVAVDVVVSDKKGHPVHDLKPSDFALLENGSAQTLGHVEEHTPDPSKVLASAPKLPAGTFTNYSTAPTSGALNILLLDALNTPLEFQAFVRQEIARYLKSPIAGTQIAVFGLGSQLHLLQGFTADPKILADVVTGKRAKLDAPVLSNQVSQSDEQMAISNSADNSGGDFQAENIMANYLQFANERASFQLSLRIRVTLEALDALARYLSAIPGRKNLIWFSGAFPLNVLPNGDVKYPFGAAIDMSDRFRATSDLLARSQVSVYPVDARGVQGVASIDAKDGAVNNNSLAAGLGGNGSQETEMETNTGAQATMLLMAEQTGGKAFINTNDLKQAVQKSIDGGSSYYTLSYSPQNRDWKGEYRKLEVKLAQKGYSLSYRRGYFADDPEAPAGSKSSASQPVKSYDPMRVAMLFGSPDPTEIVFSATVHPATGTAESEPAPNNRPDGKAAGPWMRYDVLFKADPRAIDAPATAAGHHIHVGFVTYVYDSSGKIVDSVSSMVDKDVPQDRYEAMQKEGIAYGLQVSVPAKGEYFLRIGLQDQASSRVGALTIPVASVARLKPLSH